MTQTLHDKLKTNKLLVDPTTNPDNFYIVQPTPGMVIKFKKARLQFSHDEEQKCFLNIAHCIEIPAPDNIENEAELAAMMKVDETTCSIPLSLGDMDCVKDKAGENALKFDVVVNSDFYHEKFSKSKFYQQLTIIEALNKIESVHQVRITRSTQVILQNKKVFGALESHKIPKFPENFQEAEEKRKRIIDLTDSKDPFSTYQHENVSMWLENGKLFKAIIRINEIVKADFLVLQANNDHLILFIRGEKRIADFYVPVELDNTSLKAKIIDGKNDETTVEICGSFSIINQKFAD